MSSSYYNTTHLTGEELKQAWKDAETQEQQILILFRKYHDRLFTPFEVLDRVYPNGDVPITSVRRAITNLTECRALLKTEVQRDGPYGKPSYCWRLA